MHTLLVYLPLILFLPSSLESFAIFVGMMRAHANILNNTEDREEENNYPLASRHPDVTCPKLVSAHTVLLACQLDVSWSSQGRRNLSGEHAPIRLMQASLMEAFPGLMIDVGGRNVPGCCQVTGGGA